MLVFKEIYLRKGKFDVKYFNTYEFTVFICPVQLFNRRNNYMSVNTGLFVLVHLSQTSVEKIAENQRCNKEYYHGIRF